MSDVLVLFGISWMAVAAIIGFLLSKHHEVANAQLEQIAASGDLAAYHRVREGYRRKKMTHAHMFLFPLVVVAIGLAMARMSYSEGVLRVLGIVLIAATVIWTAGGLRLNRVLMVIGDLALLAGMVAAAIGLAMALM